MLAVERLAGLREHLDGPVRRARDGAAVYDHAERFGAGYQSPLLGRKGWSSTSSSPSAAIGSIPGPVSASITS